MTSKKQVQTLPTANQILTNPLNNSYSKFQYSFSKAQRFNINKKNNQQYRYYDLPSTKTKIAVSFGEGQKGCFGKIKDQIPPPTKYNPYTEGDFQYYAKKQQKNWKGFKFTSGRQKLKNGSFIQSNKNPGPGNYNPNPSVIMNRSQSDFIIPKQSRFHQQHKNPETNNATEKSNIKGDSPGPGQYQLKSTLGSQNKILSQDKNYPCIKLVQPTSLSRRINTQPRIKIYNPEVTKKGEALNMQKTRKGFTLGKSKRSDFVKNKDIPGPGKYRVFSQFICQSK